ncbi:MAG: hypothetical protein ABWW69_04880 [Pyrodictiaceae archaeon]
MKVRVQDVEDIWSYRRAIYVEARGRRYVAAYDGLGNCLGGSCENIARILSMLVNCKLIASRVLSDWADQFFSEKITEYFYLCEK